jgi:hypothetical protein
MSKASDRKFIFDKYGGKCAYCGCELQKGWHVDHIEAHWHNMTLEECEKYKLKKGADTLENSNPSCPRCNRWKDTFTIEKFREELQKQCERLQRDSSAYRMAKDYGLIKETGVKVKFYFETL